MSKPLQKQSTLPKQDVWAELKEKLPWQQNPADTAKREVIWKKFDGNGNGYLSLAEVDGGMRDVVKLPQLFDLKPVIMRAFMSAKNKVKSKSKIGDDYVEKAEFRFLLKYLRQYYEYFMAFKAIDKGGDGRVSQQEFTLAGPILQKWGIDMKDPVKQWKSADKDGKGSLLFIEFVEWATKNSLDTDFDDNQDKEKVEQAVANLKAQPNGPAPAMANGKPVIVQAAPTPAPSNVANKQSPKNTAPAQKVDPIWAELKEKLPWQLNSTDTPKRDAIWKSFDGNGNGYLSLAEIDRGMRDVVKLPVLFDLKPVIMRAFMSAKNKVKSKSKVGDDYVQKSEFRFLLKYLRQYYEYFMAFKAIDKGGDGRISQPEFVAASPIMQKWGIDMKDPIKQWKSADKDGKGQILFIEFVEWATKISLDTDFDDNQDQDIVQAAVQNLKAAPQQPLKQQTITKVAPYNSKSDLNLTQTNASEKTPLNKPEAAKPQPAKAKPQPAKATAPHDQSQGMHDKVTSIKLQPPYGLVILAVSILLGPMSTGIAGILHKEHMVPALIICLLQYLTIWLFLIGYIWGIYVAFRIYQNSK